MSSGQGNRRNPAEANAPGVDHDDMPDTVTYWQTYVGTVVKPLSTFRRLRDDRRAAQKGWLALMVVLATYTLILVTFVFREYPAAAPTVLPIAVEDQYRVQVWYQGPLFTVATLMLTGLLRLLALAKQRTQRAAVLFARVSLATTVPFALTTMAVELVIAALVLAQVLKPQEVLGWLQGEGALFANAYQVVGILWIVALLAVAARVTVGVRWWHGIALGVMLAVIYGLPIALFIR